MHDRSIERHTGEDTPGSCITQNFGLHLPIGSRSGMSSYRARSGGSVRANLEFCREQLIHPALVHDHEDVVDARNPDLSAPSAACNREEGRRAPSSFCTAGGYPFSELRGHHEPRFDLVRNHGNALGVFNNFQRNPFVRRVHDFLQNLTSILQTLFDFCVGCTCPQGSRESKHRDE